MQGENPSECAIRELKEETGIEAADWVELERIVHEGHHSLYVEFLHITDCQRDIIALQKDETIAYKRTAKEEILDIREEVASSRALKLLAEQRI